MWYNKAGRPRSSPFPLRGKLVWYSGLMCRVCFRSGGLGTGLFGVNFSVQCCLSNFLRI
ncbi:MAG: hypothetical protein LBQ66_14720 [Planctomycetaceae bacterium]|nr:hypothetical protein [Planctomycetaceae bacterium]